VQVAGESGWPNPRFTTSTRQEDLDTPSEEVITIPRRVLRRVAFFIYVVLAVAVVGTGGLVLSRSNPPQTVKIVQGGGVSTIDSLAPAINSSEYQAVFLTNGQIYFGKLTAPGGDFYYLRHIYYLQNQASVQGGKAVHPTLTKLGSEIHGPEDLMVINRSQILFMENLKPTGEVSKAISSAGGG
jgi:hypothetical protein